MKMNWREENGNYRHVHGSIMKPGRNVQTEQDVEDLELPFTEWVLPTLPLAVVECQSKLQSMSYKTA